MNDTNLISAETVLKAPPAPGNVRAGLAGYAEWSGSPQVLTDAVELIDQQAQRIADLEAERDKLSRGYRSQHDADSAELRRLCADRDAARKERDKLRARLTEIEAQDPICWAVIDPTGGGSVEYTAAWKEACHEHISDMITEADMPEAANFLVRPLITLPVLAQGTPEAKEFRTSREGRAEVARFFAEHLRRHDFARYINDTLAADFACALAPTLHAVMAAAPEVAR